MMCWLVEMNIPVFSTVLSNAKICAVSFETWRWNDGLVIRTQQNDHNRISWLRFARLSVQMFVPQTKPSTMKLVREACVDGFGGMLDWTCMNSLWLLLHSRLAFISCVFVRQDRNEIYPKKNPHESAAAWFITEEQLLSLLLLLLQTSFFFSVGDDGRYLRSLDAVWWLEIVSPWKSFAAREHRSIL